MSYQFAKRTLYTGTQRALLKIKDFISCWSYHAPRRCERTVPYYIKCANQFSTNAVLSHFCTDPYKKVLCGRCTRRIKPQRPNLCIAHRHEKDEEVLPPGLPIGIVQADHRAFSTEDISQRQRLILQLHFTLTYLQTRFMIVEDDRHH